MKSLRRIAIGRLIVSGLMACSCGGIASAQDVYQPIILAFAGSGAFGVDGDGGPAVNAQSAYPYDATTDGKGNVFISDIGSGRIRKVSAGVISTVAGGGSDPGEGVAATLASLTTPQGVAVDAAGNLYIVETVNNRVRKVDAVTGLITTIAGDGTAGFSGDGGPATSAQLNNPWGVAVDRFGNVYIGDAYNYRIRKVDAGSGTMSTIAGSGFGNSGDGGPATNAKFNVPNGVAVSESGDVYIADSANHQIRKVDHSTGIISKIAGNGPGYSGDGGAATAAKLFFPEDLVLDSAGNIYIADTRNSRIRRIDAVTGVITTVAGNGNATDSSDGVPATSASLREPYGIAVDPSGNVFVADTGNNRVREVRARPINCNGFAAPVDMNNVVNVAQAGRAVSLAWRCLEGTSPLNDAWRIKLSQRQYSCPSSSVAPTDDVEVYANGATGLISERDGYWRLNWATTKNYAGVCADVTMFVDTEQKLTAKFRFKK